MSTMASAIPRTSRLGIRLVKSDPGPMVMRSALAMASRVCGHRADIGRDKEQFVDASFACSDFGLAAHARAVFHQCFEFNVGSRRRIDMSARQQNF